MRRKHFASFVAVAFLFAALSPGRAATPSSGTIAPTGNVQSWTGPEATSAYEVTTRCGDPGVVCDDYLLTVDVPLTYWEDHNGGAKIHIEWLKPSDVFDFKVFDRGGKVVAESVYTLPRDVGITSRDAVIETPSREAGPYRVHVRYQETSQAGYSGTATLVSNDGAVALKGAGAFFDSSEPLYFAPTTTVSAHFLGAEPQMTMERVLPGARAGATDPDRIFVDYPLSFRAQIGQLNRSADGGDSFRLLIDPACANRSRPTCQTGGGGDSDNDVNMFTGTLFFADQEGFVAQESIASSTDHGDTFPAARQWAVTNTNSAADREWIAAADEGSIQVGSRKVEAFLTYARVATGIFVQGIDEDGLPIPQPVAQIGTTIGVPGRIEVDTSGGPGHGWVYVAYPAVSAQGSNQPTGIHVASAPGNDYQDRQAWVSNKVTSDFPDVFVWLTLDTRGNAYATWVEDGIVYYSYSLIDDPANHPRTGRPGTYWSRQYRASAPNVSSAIFPTITAGTPGRMAVSYLGSEDFSGSSAAAPNDARWHAYAAVVESATGQSGAPVVHTGRVSHRVIHTGPINGEDSSLLDFIDIDHDQDGRVGVAFMDNNSTFAEVAVAAEDPAFRGVRTKPFTQFAKQTSGPSLVASAPDVNVSIPSSARADSAGDSTWPNTSDGRYLPSLDALGASLDLEGEQIVARIPLPNGSTALADEDLATFNQAPSGALPAARIQYVVRFSNEDDVFHMSTEIARDGTMASFGGRLDENDANAEGGTVVMASYRRDAFYPVIGSLEEGSLVLRGAASAFGLGPGSNLFGVSAFTMAGPTEQNETVFSPMRTVDATPPFDVALGAAAPTASPSPTPTPDQTENPSARCDIVGTSGNDYLVGTDLPETICGLGGDDLVLGGEGDDTIYGGADDDRLFGQGGEDLLNGRQGSDELRGGADRDILLGRLQGDDLHGGSSDDFLRGGRGRDTCRGGSGRNHLRGCDNP